MICPLGHYAFSELDNVVALGWRVPSSDFVLLFLSWKTLPSDDKVHFVCIKVVMFVQGFRQPSQLFIFVLEELGYSLK